MPPPSASDNPQPGVTYRPPPCRRTARPICPLPTRGCAATHHWPAAGA